MYLIQLRTFVEVFRHGSLTQAAERLGLTQPAVSQHISSLETFLEKPLFRRHPRGVEPTVAAKELARRTATQLDHIEEVLSETRARTTRLAGTLHVSGPSDILSDLVSPHLSAITKNNMSVSMLPGTGQAVWNRLLEGTADFGFTVMTPKDGRLEFEIAGREELLLTVHPDMANAFRKSTDFGPILEDLPYVGYSDQRDLIRFWTRHNGVDVGGAEEVVTAPDLRALRTLVAAGLGWSVLPRYLVIDHLRNGSLIAIPGSNGPMFADFHLVRTRASRRTPRLVKARNLLMDSFRAHYGTPPPRL